MGRSRTSRRRGGPDRPTDRPTDVPAVHSTRGRVPVRITTRRGGPARRASAIRELTPVQLTEITIPATRGPSTARSVEPGTSGTAGSGNRRSERIKTLVQEKRERRAQRIKNPARRSRSRLPNVPTTDGTVLDLCEPIFDKIIERYENLRLLLPSTRTRILRLQDELSTSMALNIKKDLQLHITKWASWLQRNFPIENVLRELTRAHYEAGPTMQDLLAFALAFHKVALDAKGRCQHDWEESLQYQEIFDKDVRPLNYAEGQQIKRYVRECINDLSTSHIECTQLYRHAKQLLDEVLSLTEEPLSNNLSFEEIWSSSTHENDD